MTNLSLYADAIVNLALADGVARFDLVTLSAVDVDAKKVEIKPVASVATSVQGLIRMHEQLSQVMAKLAEEGVVKPAPKSDTERGQS